MRKYSFIEEFLGVIFRKRFHFIDYIIIGRAACFRYIEGLFGMED